MKQTNQKYINKEMAMMAALTTESMLLHEGYDAMLYWADRLKYYCIVIDHLSGNPLEEYPNYECTRARTEKRKEEIFTQTTLIFEY